MTRLARVTAGAAVTCPGERQGTILCADDFAITPAVSRGITELALARRLSATSAIVTLPGWPDEARELAGLRSYVACGLHLNLTVGAPLGPMPRLAPEGTFPEHVQLVRGSLLRSVDGAEVAEEIDRQLTAFVSAVGHDPDFIDGHQHVHTLPIVRKSLLAVLARRFPGRKPLLRDPTDSLRAIFSRKTTVPKALALNLLSGGFGARARALDFPTNHGFSGFSSFDTRQPYAGELERFFLALGSRHLVMCHPGYVDDALADLDSVTHRRRQELDALFEMPRLENLIWHVRRRADGPPVDWNEALPT